MFNLIDPETHGARDALCAQADILAFVAAAIDAIATVGQLSKPEAHGLCLVLDACRHVARDVEQLVGELVMTPEQVAAIDAEERRTNKENWSAPTPRLTEEDSGAAEVGTSRTATAQRNG